MRKYLSAIVFTMTSFLIFPLVTNAQKSTDKAFKGFDKFVEKAMEDWNVPGVAIGIVKDGEVIYTKGYGYKDVENKKKVTVNTQFAIGSCSKAFAAATVAMCVDDGLLEFDEAIKTYIPEFKLHDDYATEHINARDLLSHRSGLPRHDLVWYGSDKSREELIDALQYLEPTTEFRQAWQYQNLMFMTAGYLVEKVSGQSWEDYTQQRIFEPLGMKNSNFSVIDMQKTTDFALPYSEEDSKLTKMDFRNIDAIGPAGSINSSIIDMSEWVKFQLNKGAVGEKTLIQGANFNQMHSPQMVMPGDIRYEELSYANYGMGWMISSYRGHLRVDHGGNIDGFSASVGMLPRDGIGVVVLTNINGTALTSIIRNNVFDRLLEMDEVDWNGRLLEDRKKALANNDDTEEEEEDPLQKKFTSPTHPLEDYTGIFWDEAYGESTISQKDEKLSLEIRGFEMELEHYHYNIFQIKEGLMKGAKITYEMNKYGEIEKLLIPLERGIDDIEFVKMITSEELTPEDLEKYVGDYEFKGTTAKVAIQDKNVLTVTVPGQPTYLLKPGKEHFFDFKDLEGFSIFFKVTDAGDVKSLTFNQPNGNFTFQKQE